MKTASYVEELTFQCKQTERNVKNTSEIKCESGWRRLIFRLIEQKIAKELETKLRIKN